jgi:hypothetical protein
LPYLWTTTTGLIWCWVSKCRTLFWQHKQDFYLAANICYFRLLVNISNKNQDILTFFHNVNHTTIILQFCVINLFRLFVFVKETSVFH